MSAAKIPTLDTEFNQKYQLLAKIGSGGMGEVFLGIQRGAVDFSRLVVIKRIHDSDVPAEYSEANAKMFLNEASVIASLNHPHIVKIYDFCMAGASFCIVMEYVEGETLKYIFSECGKQDKQFPVGLACSIIYDACNTLHYAHNATSNTGELRNIIHRDIGLHNLMLDSSGYLKIIDFGIAKSSIHTDMTSPGMIKGNPSYMAPELFTQKTQDHRLDIYALGLCLYELLTQQRAYQFSSTATVGEVIQEITHRELPPPSPLVSDLPKGIDDIVAKAVAKDRDERYQTVEEFGQDLKRSAGHVFMTGSEPQKWFTKNFATRLKERREFGGKILEIAKNSDSGTETSLPSKLPGGFQIVSGITPSPIKKTPPLSDSEDESISWAVSAKRNKIVSGALLVAIVVAVSLYSLLSGESTSKTDDEKVMDNLVVSCKPPGSRLSIDGKELGLIGSESLTFHVEPNKKHELVISKDGYRDFALPFIGPSTGEKRINAQLIKIETAVAEKDEAKLPSTMVSATEESDLPEKKRVSKKKPRSKKGKKKVRLKRKKPESNKKKRKIPLPDDDEVRKIPVMLD